MRFDLHSASFPASGAPEPIPSGAPDVAAFLEPLQSIPEPLICSARAFQTFVKRDSVVLGRDRLPPICSLPSPLNLMPIMHN